MTVHYAKQDWEVVDYESYILDPDIVDRATGEPLMLRGPEPGRPLVPGSYFVCIGAAQTFGRFCQRPFPALLADRLDMPCLNMGRGGAGPSFFADGSDRLMEYLAGARFVIIQVMAGRSESNSLFHSRGLGALTRVKDGVEIGCDEAFAQILAENDLDTVKAIVEETRDNWVKSYERLFSKIPVPKVLLWFSTRAPDYEEGYNGVYELFGAFPQLVNRAMIDRIRNGCDAYVELASQHGMPHKLISRFTGEPVTVRDPWAGEWTEDWYYGSPEMHEDATNLLEQPCRAVARQTRAAPSKRRAPGPVPFIVLGKARCGSTHLLGLLNSHPKIIGFGELFRDEDTIGWDLRPYDAERQSPDLIEKMRKEPVRFLEEEVLIEQRPGLAAVGFKIFYYQNSPESQSELWSYLRSHGDLRVIHLKRRNTLRELLSLKRAQMTNEWYTTVETEDKAAPITLDYEECVREFEYARDTKERFDRFFKNSAVLEVAYEDLAENVEIEMRRVQRFLGVKEKRLSPLVVKQSHRPLSAAVANYAELRQAFSNTSWEHFFDDE